MIKLSDFGSARKILCQEDLRLQGTAEYLAPELISGDDASPAADLWAVGCVLYQLLAGRVPFYQADQSKLFEKIKSFPVIFPVNFPKEARNLVESLMMKDPMKRITIQEIKKHKFFEGFDWNNISAQEPPIPSKGEVETSGIDVKVKQRKFSMMFTQLTQPKHYQYQDMLEPIEEVDELSYSQ